jgi:POTRA domain-containing FtsQ-type protein
VTSAVRPRPVRRPPARRARAETVLVERRREVSRAQGRRRRTVLLCGVAGLATIAGTWWVLTGPLATIHGVTVSGYDGPDRAAIEKTVDLIAGQATVVHPPVVKIREALARFPWVQDVHVSRDLPRGIRVDVVQAHPVAILVPASGRRMLLSSAGRVLGPAAGTTGLAQVRVATPSPPLGAQLRSVRTAAPLEILRGLRPAIADRVRGLRLSGGVVTGRLAAGPEIRMGTPDRLDVKTRALSTVLDNLPDAEERRATYVDVSVPERPAVGGVVAVTTTSTPSTTG